MPLDKQSKYMEYRSPRFAALICLSLATVSCSQIETPQETSNEARPNVLLIVVDDMGLADIGSFGGEIETPNLDKFAFDGVRLTNFHASPVCSVTRAMLLTGVDAHKAGLGNMAEELAPNQVGKPGYEGELNDRVVTLATILKEDGYSTYMTGKWHLGMSDEASPHNRGFNKSFSMLAGGASHFKDMRPAYAPSPEIKAPYRDNGQRIEVLPETFEYSSQFFVDQMLDYMKTDAQNTATQDKPFFAYLAFTTPHWPLQAPDQAIAKYEGRYAMGYDVLRKERLARQIDLGILPKGTPENIAPPKALPWNELSDGQQLNQSKAMEIYAAMIDETDVQLGRLFDYLEQTGELDNTLIIFMSDNGAEGHDLDETWPADQFPKIRQTIDESHDFSYENMGRPNSYVLYGANWARAGAPAFRLHKGFPTEGGKRVAAFMHGKGISSGRIENRYTSVIDIMPTILDYTNNSHPTDNDKSSRLEAPTGSSMRELLETQSLETYVDAGVEAGEVLGKYFVRKGDWKIINMPAPHGTGEWQLYNIRNDIGETTDLAQGQPDRLKDLVSEWDEYAKANGVILPNSVSGY